MSTKAFGRAFKRFPRMIVFDVDKTLWPFWVDTHTSPPYSLREGNVVDGNGMRIELFPEAGEVLTHLRKIEGLELAYASRTGEPAWMRDLAGLIELSPDCTMWDLPDYKEVYPVELMHHHTYAYLCKIIKLIGYMYIGFQAQAL